MLDPGVGFSKTDEQNMALIRRAAEFRKLGFPLFYGISRKGFIGRMYGIPCPADRDEATAQLQLGLCHVGIEALRVHNPAATLRAISKKSPIPSDTGLQAFQSLRRQTERNGLREMSLDEINAEINDTRDDIE